MRTASRKALSYVLAGAMTFASFSYIGVKNVNAANKGTSDDPYLISNVSELQSFADKVNNDIKVTLCAKLVKDINLKGVKDFTPIGNENVIFEGTFDGNNHTISNMVIDQKNDAFLGLFGNNKGNIKNVNLVGSDIKGTTLTGAIVGNNEKGGLVINCSTTMGKIKCSDTKAAGIAGVNDGEIVNCYARTDVEAKNIVGGIVGENKGLVKNVYATEEVKATKGENVGAIAGKTKSLDNVKDCFYKNQKVEYKKGNKKENLDIKAFGNIDNEDVNEDTAKVYNEASLMKGDAFLDRLNSNVNALKGAYPEIASWIIDKNKNDSYPIFGAITSDDTNDATIKNEIVKKLSNLSYKSGSVNNDTDKVSKTDKDKGNKNKDKKNNKHNKKNPTNNPTQEPIIDPTETPTQAPSGQPTNAPTDNGDDILVTDVPDEPTESVEPTNIDEPTESVEPTDTDEPNETSDPTESVEPTDTDEPTESVEPTDTSEPTGEPTTCPCKDKCKAKKELCKAKKELCSKKWHAWWVQNKLIKAWWDLYYANINLCGKKQALEKVKKEADCAKKNADLLLKAAQNKAFWANLDAKNKGKKWEDAKKALSDAKQKQKEANEKLDKLKKEAQKADERYQAAKKAKDSAKVTRQAADKAVEAAQKVVDLLNASLNNISADSKFLEAQQKAIEKQKEAAKKAEKALKEKEKADKKLADAKKQEDEAKKKAEEAKKAKEKAKVTQQEAKKALEDAKKAQKTADDNIKNADKKVKEKEAAKENADKLAKEAKTAKENADKLVKEAENKKTEADKKASEAEKASNEATKAAKDAADAQKDSRQGSTRCKRCTRSSSDK